MEDSQVKLILLKERTEYLIGVLTELDEEPSVFIERCFEVLDDGSLSPFPKHTLQRDLFLTSESIFTILDPSPNLLETYKDT